MAFVLSAPGLSDYKSYRMLMLKGSSRKVFLLLPFHFERMREQKHDESYVSHLFLPTILRAQVHLPLTDAETVAQRGEPPHLSSNPRMLYSQVFTSCSLESFLQNCIFFCNCNFFHYTTQATGPLPFYLLITLCNFLPSPPPSHQGPHNFVPKSLPPPLAPMISLSPILISSTLLMRCSALRFIE